MFSTPIYESWGPGSNSGTDSRWLAYPTAISFPFRLVDLWVPEEGNLVNCMSHLPLIQWVLGLHRFKSQINGDGRQCRKQQPMASVAYSGRLFNSEVVILPFFESVIPCSTPDARTVYTQQPSSRSCCLSSGPFQAFIDNLITNIDN